MSDLYHYILKDPVAQQVRDILMKKLGGMRLWNKKNWEKTWTEIMAVASEELDE